MLDGLLLSIAPRVLHGLGKKLARGRFHLARQVPSGATHLEVESAELTLMLEGIDLSQATRRKRWRPPKGSDDAVMSSEPGRLLARPAEASFQAR